MIRLRLALASVWRAALPFALALCACAGWEPTRNAVVRRQAEAQLRGCMSGTLCTQAQACIAESAAFCRAHQLEATCGTDAAFVEPIRCQINDH
jgi:hypothetical protein